MKAKIVRIGNSRGVRLPKPLIEEAGLPEHVELRVREGAIVISAATSARAGWAAAAQRMHQLRDDVLLDAPLPTRFDRENWKW